MSNANEPAFPMVEQRGEEGQRYGLTKREHLAELVFVQLLRGAVIPPGTDVSDQMAYGARVAINAADIFYAELEKTP